MNDHTPAVESEDIRQLKLLGVFHYVLGGVMALFGMCPLIYVIIGLLMMAGVMVDDSHRTSSRQPTVQVMQMDAIVMPVQFQVDVPGASEPGQTQQQDAPTRQSNSRNNQSPSQQKPSYEDKNWSQASDANSTVEGHGSTTHLSEADRNAAVGAGLFMMILGLVLAVLTWVQAILLLIAGRNLSKQRGHTYCFVIAVLECLWMPLGTILGVFTIITLTRPSVKALFEANKTGQNPADVWQAR